MKKTKKLTRIMLARSANGNQIWVKPLEGQYALVRDGPTSDSPLLAMGVPTRPGTAHTWLMEVVSEVEDGNP